MNSHLEEYNGYPIKNLATAKRLDTVLRKSKETGDKDAPTQLLRIRDTTCRVIAGDASAVATCALEIGDGATFFTQNKLSESEKELSSGHRELLTVLRALQQEVEFFKTLAHQTIIWLTDSTNLVSFLTKGTMRPHIQSHVLEVFKLLSKYQIRVAPVHLRRTDYRIQWADEGSREFDPDDWGVDQASFRLLTKDWKPTVDLFAHTSNAKTDKFYSYGQAPKTSRVDAFAQNWQDELAWACPPVHLLADAIKRVENAKMMAIVVFPAWKTASFWNVAFPNGRHAVTACKAIKLFRPHVVRGRFCDNRVMQGRTCLLYTSPSPRDRQKSRMPSSA